MAVEEVHLIEVRMPDAFVKTVCGLRAAEVRTELLLTPAVTCRKCRDKAEGREK